MDEPQTSPEMVAVLTTLKELRWLQDRLEYEVMALLRAQGMSWEDIGAELGMSRQAASARYSKHQKRQAPKV